MATNPSAFVSAAPSNAPWIPSDNGMLAATAAVDAMANAFLFTAGTVYLSKCPIRVSVLATNINYVVSTAGVGASTGSFTGLYSSAGTLLSGSADIGGSLTSAADVVTPLTTPQALVAGTFVWIAFVANLATTQPTLRSWGIPSALIPNIGLTAATFRSASNGTLQTTLPASITPSANASSTSQLWAGIS